MSGEFEFIHRLTHLFPTPPEDQVWIGDDAAVLDGGQLFATDALVDGVHFDRGLCELDDIGWKALAVNVSDIAAMGGAPVAAVAALVIPPESGMPDAIASGLASAAAAMGCPVVGGDTTGGPTLVITVAILGASPEPGPVLRSGAEPGDSIFVTGTLGIAGWAMAELSAGRDPGIDATRHLNRPTPRLAEGSAAASAGATAMIDISDGLGADLGHVCEASGVGATIIERAVPLTARREFDEAVAAGDDYELCFTAPDTERVEKSFSEAGLDMPVRIGLITAQTDITVRSIDGDERPFERGGWEHDLG